MTDYWCSVHSKLYNNSEDFIEHKTECKELMRKNICLYTVYGGISCKQTFRETGSLIAHYLECHGKYACSVCLGEYDTTDELEEHYHDYTINLRLRPFRCDNCQASFMSQQYLNVLRGNKHNRKAGRENIYVSIV